MVIIWLITIGLIMITLSAKHLKIKSNTLLKMKTITVPKMNLSSMIIKPKDCAVMRKKQEKAY